MPKSHREFIIFSRNGEEHNALVISTQDVVTPATQTEPAFSVEHVTLVYLKPGLPSIPSGDAVRNNMEVVFSVPPLKEGIASGWKDVTSVETAIPPATTPVPLPVKPYTEWWMEGFVGDPNYDNDPYGLKEYHEQSAAVTIPEFAQPEFVPTDPALLAIVAEGNAQSGHGPNPPNPAEAGSSHLDNPAPASPKDESAG